MSRTTVGTRSVTVFARIADGRAADVRKRLVYRYVLAQDARDGTRSRRTHARTGRGGRALRQSAPPRQSERRDHGRCVRRGATTTAATSAAAGSGRRTCRSL